MNIRAAAAPPVRQGLLCLAATASLCALALAGADWPPPPGFALLAATIAAWCAGVCLARWRMRTRPRKLQVVATAGVSIMGGLLGWVGLAWYSAEVTGTALDWQAVIGLALVVALSAAVGITMAVASWVIVDGRSS